MLSYSTGEGTGVTSSSGIFIMIRMIIWSLVFVALSASPLLAIDDYKLGPDSQRHEGVPQGKVTKLSWSNSKIFPDTQRDWWIYVPAQYDGKTPACVMVFQDGGGYVSETGTYRVPIVFDN
jgi:hypothetical protein